jgi:hypothetical protein
VSSRLLRSEKGQTGESEVEEEPNRIVQRGSVRTNAQRFFRCSLTEYTIKGGQSLVFPSQNIPGAQKIFK